MQAAVLLQNMFLGLCLERPADDCEQVKGEGIQHYNAAWRCGFRQSWQ